MYHAIYTSRYHVVLIMVVKACGAGGEESYLANREQDLPT